MSRGLLCLSLAALCLCAGRLHCADLESLPLSKIRFSPDEGLLLEQHRQELILLKEGEPLDRRLLGQTIRNLFATGRYARIDADATVENGEVVLTFLVEPSYFVGQVNVTGVPGPPTVNQLTNATKLSAGELLTQRSVDDAEQGVLQVLRENGFPDALVQTETQKHVETQQADVTLVVEAGRRAGFGRVFVTPEPELNEADARRITGWERGTPYTERNVLRGLDRLRKYYQKQDRWQAKVNALPGGFNPDTGEIDVVLKLEPGPRVLVTVEGESFSDGQLRTYIPIFDEGVVDDDLLQEGADNLRNYLQTRGYFNATVEFQRVAMGPDEIRIIYDVNRGERYSLVHIEITGNQWFDLETIRERMLMREKSFQMRRGRYSQSLLESDIGAIEDLYRSNGFRDVSISRRVEQNYRGEQGDLAVFINIQEGKPTLVQDLIITGTEHLPADHFRPMLASIAGQPYSELEHRHGPFADPGRILQRRLSGRELRMGGAAFERGRSCHHRVPHPGRRVALHPRHDCRRAGPHQAAAGAATDPPDSRRASFAKLDVRDAAPPL